MLRFANDIAVIVESKEDLTNMLEKMNGTLNDYYMKIDQRKTNSRQQVYPNIILDGIRLETVQNFTYLYSKITNDGEIHTDTVCRII